MTSARSEAGSEGHADRGSAALPRSENVVWHEGELTREERWSAASVAGATIWFTGLSGSGKSTVAAAVERLLLDAGRISYLLDGDNLRHGLNGDLGFDAASRHENVRRVAEVARLFADAGVVALVPVISPYRSGRDHARSIHEDVGLSFLEVFVDTPIEVCEQRDPKGLYRKARAGELTGFTGIDDPYEAPLSPGLRIDGGATPVAVAAETVLAALAERRSARGGS
ncbi:MAG: adenylyl-sulfate kinase [Acidimicrobiia bacterium]|nr:adenylyl-sulfate kinase [Acidimicrobiia bacterium]